MCEFPEHVEFVKLCRQAQEVAQSSGQVTNFWWRGYKGVVAPNLPPIDAKTMYCRLMNALHKVNIKTVAETMVRKTKYYNIHVYISSSNDFQFFFLYTVCSKMVSR